MNDYMYQLDLSVEEMIDRLAQRFSNDDLLRIRKAYELAKMAHNGQTRVSGEPYIMHPIAVARIIAEEFMLDANSVVAAFLHDVVEDTPYTIDDIRERFGEDVAFLVKVVTKPSKIAGAAPDVRKQENNFRQLLDSLRHDIRAVFVKLADRLHNMRTLGDMLPEKQMKIGGETDFFYAPFANRLGLHNLRRELENLSFRFRCPDRFDRLQRLIQHDIADNRERLFAFTQKMEQLLAEKHLPVRTEVRYRLPYSIDMRMRKTGRDFLHIDHRYVVRVIYDRTKLSEIDQKRTDKAICLRIYGVLTNAFQEKVGSIINYIDVPKENGYQSFHVQLLSGCGRWDEVHISSEEMVTRTKLGLIMDRIETARDRKDAAGASHEGGVNQWLSKSDRLWIDKFCTQLQQIADNDGDGDFMEGVTASLYNEDIVVYDVDGTPVRLPQQATALDFAFERNVGKHAQYARIDDKLASLQTVLTHGCCVEIGTHPDAKPLPEWEKTVVTYRAKSYLSQYFRKLHTEAPHRCPICQPLPGQEVIGFTNETQGNGQVVIHRRDCRRAISLSAQRGDAIVKVDFPVTDFTYEVRTRLRAIDRFGLLSDITECLTKGLQLNLYSICMETRDNIVDCTIHYAVHSAEELRTAVRFLSVIDGVDEVLKA